MRVVEFCFGTWPGHNVSGFECMYPDSVDGGYDIVTPLVCPTHGRSVYWCLNVGVMWCDGGAPGWSVHTFDNHASLPWDQ